MKMLANTSDGSASITKAEFDSALADFNARLTTFEAGINSKIDSQVSSYLDRNGIWNGKAIAFSSSAKKGAGTDEAAWVWTLAGTKTTSGKIYRGQGVTDTWERFKDVSNTLSSTNYLYLLPLYNANLAQVEFFTANKSGLAVIPCVIRAWSDSETEGYTNSNSWVYNCTALSGAPTNLTFDNLTTKNLYYDNVSNHYNNVAFYGGSYPGEAAYLRTSLKATMWLEVVDASNIVLQMIKWAEIMPFVTNREFGYGNQTLGFSDAPNVAVFMFFVERDKKYYLNGRSSVAGRFGQSFCWTNTSSSYSFVVAYATKKGKIY